MDWTRGRLRCDVAVLGAGAAGMSAAIESSQQGARTVLLCKSLLGKAATVLAHDGISTRGEEALARVRELSTWGALLDLDHDAGLARRDDRVGLEVLRALQFRLLAGPVEVLMECSALRLIVRNGRVRGIALLDRASGTLRILEANAVVLATGGAGRAWSLSCAPAEATGDGVARASEAGAGLVDMDCVHFDPAGLLAPAALRGASVPERLWRAGEVA